MVEASLSAPEKRSRWDESFPGLGRENQHVQEGNRFRTRYVTLGSLHARREVGVALPRLECRGHQMQICEELTAPETAYCSGVIWLWLMQIEVEFQPFPI